MADFGCGQPWPWLDRSSEQSRRWRELGKVQREGQHDRREEEEGLVVEEKRESSASSSGVSPCTAMALAGSEEEGESEGGASARAWFFPNGGVAWPACESESSHVACAARSRSATSKCSRLVQKRQKNQLNPHFLASLYPKPSDEKLNQLHSVVEPNEDYNVA